MVAVVGLGVVSLTSIQREFEKFAEEDFPGFNHLLHVDRDLFRAQRAIETAFLTEDEDRRREAIEEYESQVERTRDRWARYLEVAHQGTEERHLQATYDR
ncbi:MAG: hypothetical protein GY939_03270, partial [Actinomycetia bacterium]|nr:hypothetical protein [Actinomycetes bacterium]